MTTDRTPDPADPEILRRAARGDTAAFGVLFDRHAAAACRYARRIVRDGSTAEDAVHEAFVRLIDAAGRGLMQPSRGTPRGLLFRTVRNICIDWFRQRSREGRAPADGEPSWRGNHEAVAARDDFECLLQTVTEPQRSALLLRVDAGLSYDEIAVILDATIPQVKTWIFRARRALAEQWMETP